MQWKWKHGNVETWEVRQYIVQKAKMGMWKRGKVEREFKVAGGMETWKTGQILVPAEAVERTYPIIIH